jgi:CheY-like chemotaxis protein
VTHRVLLVDDEEALVWSLVRQVQRERPDLAIEGLSDPEQALRRVGEAPPDVLVTDIRMPGMSGLELLLAARRLAPQLPVVVVTAYGNADVRAHLQRTPSVQYLEKPFSFESLLAAIDRALAAPTGFSGAISLPMLPDLIQLYALAQMSGALRITRGAEKGVVWFEHGAITHAECGAEQGAEAVYALLRWNGGSFSIDAGALPEKHTITASWQELLMEGCRLLDELPATPAAPGQTDLAAWRECVRDAWHSLGPLVTVSTPDALVWAVRLDDLAVEPLSGGVAEAALGTDVGGVIEQVAGLVGAVPRGSGEWLSAGVGVVVAWDRSMNLAMVFGAGLDGTPGSAARFRSIVVRWCRACGLADLT